MALLRPFKIIGRCFGGLMLLLLFLNTASAGESQGQQDFSVVGSPVPLVDEQRGHEQRGQVLR